MTYRALCSVTTLLAAALTACGDGYGPSAPHAADAVAGPAFAITAETHAGAAPARTVTMLDACDPETFNEFFGFEVCTPTTPRRGIPFDIFVASLEQNQRVDAWRFAPDIIRVPRATTFRIVNRGGIVHSFTEVEEFGGGFVPLLNELSGNPVPVPECDPADVELIAPGDHADLLIEPGAPKKYMCCIHPWMRAQSM
jgi:hypothetical protein